MTTEPPGLAARDAAIIADLLAEHPEHRPELERLRRELGVIADRIAQYQRREEELYKERVPVLRQLLDLGVPQATVARMARVTPTAVMMAVNPDKKQGRGAKPKAPTKAARGRHLTSVPPPAIATP